ncbi:MAG TPA: hypothetical protein VF099_01580 [Ktedonobacterales bacterium]
MTRRRKDPDSANLTSWLGQPYIPQDPYNRLTRGILRPSPYWFALRGRYRYGCLLWFILTAGMTVLAIVLSLADGLTSGVLITLAIVTGLTVILGLFISRFLPKTNNPARHQKHRSHHK